MVIEQGYSGCKAARVNAGLTQKQAAKRLGVCAKTLLSYENGKTIPDWDVVERIESLYGIPAYNIIFTRDNT